MNLVPSDEREVINWNQLIELIGDGGDESQRALISEMWRDMVRDMRVEWTRLSLIDDDATMRGELHRVRGIVAMWGMDGLAGAMLSFEKKPASCAAWRGEAEQLAGSREVAFAMIEDRYPQLATRN